VPGALVSLGRHSQWLAFECASLAGNGVCDVQCNVTVCLWDKGECGDVVANLLRETGLNMNANEVSSLRVVLEEIGHSKGMQAGILVGTLLIGGLVVACCLIRRARRLAELKEKQSRNYMPYGEGGDGIESVDTNSAKDAHDGPQENASQPA